MITESTEIEIYRSKFGLQHIQFKNTWVGNIQSDYFKIKVNFTGQVPTITFMFDISSNLRSRFSPDQITDTKRVIEDWDKMEYLQMSRDMARRLETELSQINNYGQGKCYVEFVTGENEVKSHFVDIHFNDTDVKFMNLDNR